MPPAPSTSMRASSFAAFGISWKGATCCWLIAEAAEGNSGFCSYTALAALSQRRIDSVMRLHQARKVNFREGRRLGDDDRLVTWQKPAQRTDAWSREAWEALPESLSQN